MPGQIVWLPDAVKDLARLRAFIQEKNPSAAARAASLILEGAKLARNNPEAGRPVNNLAPFRDILVPFGTGNYVIRYCEERGNVVIVRVWHSKEART